MGVQSTATVIIGCKVDIDELQRKHKNQRTERGCEHEMLDDAKFCSVCGARRTVVVEDDFDIYEFLEGLKGVDHEFTTDALELVVGSTLASTGDINAGGEDLGFVKLSGDEFAKIADQVKAKLKVHDLLDLDRFGLYLVGCCSY